LEKLKAGMKIEGPAIILNATSTIVIEPGSTSFIDEYGNIEIKIEEGNTESDCKQYTEIE